MAVTLVRDEIRAIRIGDLGQEEILTDVKTNRIGSVMFVDPTTGKGTLAQADAIENIGAGAARGTILGVAGSAAITSLNNESVTLWRDGDIFLGVDALADLDFGDPVFLSEATAGAMTDAAPDGVGEVVVQIGHVVPMVRHNFMGATVIDKALRLDTVWLAQVGAVAEIAEPEEE